MSTPEYERWRQAQEEDVAREVARLTAGEITLEEVLHTVSGFFPSEIIVPYCRALEDRVARYERLVVALGSLWEHLDPPRLAAAWGPVTEALADLL